MDDDMKITYEDDMKITLYEDDIKDLFEICEDNEVIRDEIQNFFEERYRR